MPTSSSLPLCQLPPPSLSAYFLLPPSYIPLSSALCSYSLTLLSDFSSSDGHTDSAFGESIVSSSSVSTPVGGHSSNRFNPTLRTTASHEEETGNDLVSQQSSSSNLLESAPVYAQEAREDEEAGYARLEDIRSAKQSRQKARLVVCCVSLHKTSRT